MTLDEIEARVVRAVAGKWTTSVERLKREALVMHARGDISADDLTRLLDRLQLPTTSEATAAVLLLRKARDHGNAQVEGRTTARVVPQAVDAVRTAARKPAAALVEVRRRLGIVPLRTTGELLATLAPLTTSASEMEGALSWATHATANSAIREASAQTGSKLVFVAERDACVRCIAYAGDTQETEGSTFGGGPSFLGGLTEPLPFPPVHPRCRCSIEEYADPAVPAAMKREAVRSVLRGFSLPSESNAQRIRAARNALQRDLAAPESVKDYARANVRAGKFRTRVVPTGKIR